MGKGGEKKPVKWCICESAAEETLSCEGNPAINERNVSMSACLSESPCNTAIQSQLLNCGSPHHFRARCAGSRNTGEQREWHRLFEWATVEGACVCLPHLLTGDYAAGHRNYSHEDEERWRLSSWSKHVRDVRQVLLEEEIWSTLFNPSQDLFGIWQGCASPKAKEVKSR